MRKELELLQLELNNSCGELHKIERNKINVVTDFGNESHIELKEKERGCKVYPFYFSEIPIYVFEWDDCPIFQTSNTDVKRQVEIIKSWVLKKTKPSEIQTQFPEIELNKLAKYYEKGEGVKGEFIESWNETEETFFNSIEYHIDKESIRLIKEMRVKGLNESLRIGVRLSWLILSRARRHFINENIPHIGIYFLGNNQMKIYSNLNDKTKELEVEVKYEGYLERLVKELLKEEIK
ncbi:hypothetical protein ABHQ57_00495 [Tenacibaculum sp. ZH5_bin.1]|uniref:hypothetical protein n=1 Tax=Tenacibaculum TaxID=104267 RepID=UPI00142F3D5C|nr:hypothetical protein [Tenacibaculum mesophilum]KAF9658921.1 hypothetical protein HBA12_01350 [Tenacibaculum mesophilum]